MKRLLLTLLVLYTGLVCRAQPFGNEWIDYTQPHYKFKLLDYGFYRIPYSVLSAAIPNIQSVNPAHLALYRNGVAVPIFVSNNIALGVNDYIDFYGERNDALVDSFYYKTAANQNNEYANLLTDSSTYYLTLRPNLVNPRYIEVPNNLSNLPAKEVYCWRKPFLQYFIGAYSEGKYYSVGSDEIYKSLYEEGEGFVNSTFFGTTSNASQAVNYAVNRNLPNLYTGGPDAVFKTSFVNRSNEFHQVNITLNGTTIYQQPGASGFRMQKVNQNIPISLLNSGSNTFVYSENGTAISNKQNSLTLCEIEYPATTDAAGLNKFWFSLDADPINKKYIEITGFNDNGSQPLLYDLTNNYVLKSTQPPGVSPLKYALPPSAVKRNLLLISGAAPSLFTINALNVVALTNFSAVNKQGDYIIISNSKLFNDGNGVNWVEEYRKYRDIDDNPTAGKYQAVVVDVSELYDQFGYGIHKSPLAIRNFIYYAKNNWTIRPEHVFLVGKAREYNAMRYNTTALNQCLVPTFGYPGSDILFAASRNSDEPIVAIGRLAAQTGIEVKDYLEKIQVYEAAQNTYASNQDIPNKLWQKQVLHFGGGTGASERLQFRNYLASYELTAEDTAWGANVTSFFAQQTSAPIDESQAQIIRGKIEEGASLLTFFGHSATGNFDFSIDEPENYQNLGKYPVIISNGCFAGFIHDAGKGYSERFVMPKDKGAAAFLATSSLSLSSGLNNFTSKLYRQLAVPSYKKTFGIMNKETVRDMINCNCSSDFDMMVAYEMTLHGDPGIILNQYPKPDYAIDESSVFFTPATITPGQDSFEVSVVVTNLGRAIKDSIAVSLTRTIFDGNSPIVYNRKKYIAAPYYRDTVRFTFPTSISNLGAGQNLFSPYVEADFEVDEMAEMNNGLLAPVSIYIQSDDVLPIYPYEFAIVPQQGVTLKASTVNPFAPARNYKFQIDTSELFIAPLQSGNVFQTGGVLHFTPSINYLDSTVYYWRVAIDSTTPNWHYSSFIYLNGEYPGWNQSHYFQYKKDDSLYIRLDEDRRFKFRNTVNTIQLTTGVADAVGGSLDADLMGWNLNDYNMHRFRMGGCGFLSGITIAVIDSVSGQALPSVNIVSDNYGDTYGNMHCSNKYYLQYGFDFPTLGTHPTTNSSAPFYQKKWSEVIKTFIDSVPNGNYILLYSNNNMNSNYLQWDTTLMNTMFSLGFIQANLLKTGQVGGPFAYFTQKGNVNYPSFVAIQNGYTPALDTAITFNGNWYQGQFTSVKIGPAVEWNSMHWSKESVEPIVTDEDTIDIIGIDNNGVETVLQSTAQENNLFIGANSISAVQYPFLRLRLRTKDLTSQTPAQLQYWRILYKKPPEAAINPSAHFVLTDSLSLGSNLHLEIGLESITDIDMDSMLTKYVVRDALFNITNSYLRYDSLRGLDTMHLIFDMQIAGSNYEGLNKIIVEANPDNDQIEQYHFNNIAEINFKTFGDKINPLLDVTFDGQHIFNGDIVSARPNILITLKDENTFLALNDTALLNIYLKYPGEATPRRMNYDDIVMKFYPADSSNLTNGRNKAQVELKPEQLPDGKYELIIKDRDRSNNHSSNQNRYEGSVYYDYKTSFEVINKPMVSNVLNYPNPFTTATKFIFTLTGSRIPDFMKIQIMTIKGTVVKEIMKEELGPLRIGRNITEYTWDGRDQYGDLLANGVYFYRVVTQLDDEKMEHYSQGYDRYFKKGFGKLVIVR